MIKSARFLGEELLKAGILTQEQLRQAEEEHKKTKARFFTIILQKGFLTENTLADFASSQHGVPRVDLSDYDIHIALTEFVPE